MAGYAGSQHLMGPPEGRQEPQRDPRQRHQEEAILDLKQASFRGKRRRTRKARAQAKRRKQAGLGDMASSLGSLASTAGNTLGHHARNLPHQTLGETPFNVAHNVGTVFNRMRQPPSPMQAQSPPLDHGYEQFQAPQSTPSPLYAAR